MRHQPFPFALLGHEIDKGTDNRSRRAAVEPAHRVGQVTRLDAMLKQ